MTEDLEQRREDTAVGRALREARRIGPTQPRVHISWQTDTGRTTGKWLTDEPLHVERANFAEAATELYDAALRMGRGRSNDGANLSTRPTQARKYGQPQRSSTKPQHAATSRTATSAGERLLRPLIVDSS